MQIIISKNIAAKLKDKHAVKVREVEQCFENLTDGFLEDTREQHKSDPPTMWFIAPTNTNRILKVVFVCSDNKFYIRTAYEPNVKELDIYMNNI